MRFLILNVQVEGRDAAGRAFQIGENPLRLMCSFVKLLTLALRSQGSCIIEGCPLVPETSIITTTIAPEPPGGVSSCQCSLDA